MASSVESWENTDALRSAQALKAHSTMPSSSADEGDALRLPEIEGQRAGDGVGLVDEDIFVLVEDEVDAHHALQVHGAEGAHGEVAHGLGGLFADGRGDDAHLRGHAARALGVARILSLEGEELLLCHRHLQFRSLHMVAVPSTEQLTSRSGDTAFSTRMR